MITLSAKRVAEVQAAAGTVMGTHGYAYAISRDGDTAAFGTWTFDPATGFEYNLVVNVPEPIAQIVLRGKNENYIREWDFQALEGRIHWTTT